VLRLAIVPSPWWKKDGEADGKIMRGEEKAETG
jgi:hypothetical protein